MKKIAILTFHRALNFGANLQAFALQETILEKYEACILDYRCPAIETFYFRRKSVKDIIKSIVFPQFTKQIKIRREHFFEFSKNYRLSEVYTPDNIENANLGMIMIFLYVEAIKFGIQLLLVTIITIFCSLQKRKKDIHMLLV